MFRAVVVDATRPSLAAQPLGWSRPRFLRKARSGVTSQRNPDCYSATTSNQRGDKAVFDRQEEP
jgi:hypothetical protein